MYVRMCVCAEVLEENIACICTYSYKSALVPSSGIPAEGKQYNVCENGTIYALSYEACSAQ
jgi:hypothetical protein